MIRRSPLLLIFLAAAFLFKFEAHASPSAGSLVKRMSSVLKWRRAPPKATRNDGDHLDFENGYLVETLVEGNKLGVLPYTLRVSPEGELFVVDADNSNIVRITPPLSQYSRARLVAGSFLGHSGHVDGKPSDARFIHPKGVTMDEKGNIYVADTGNLAIRKIGEAGVTTIAGGKSNFPGYMDGPSEDAKFSADFDVLYVKRTCSLLVIDRGNAALRQISLQQDECDHQFSSVSTTDIVMIVGAVLAGYISCLLQHGFGPLSSKKGGCKTEEQKPAKEDMPAVVVECLKEDPVAGWPSFGQLFSDLLKFAAEGLGCLLLNLFPHRLIPGKQGLTPLKDTLKMPEDIPEIPLPPKPEITSTVAETETRHSANIIADTLPLKILKSSKTPKAKDPSVPSKHRSSKRQDYAEFYGSSSGDPSPQLSSKSQKERSRHRHREKSGDVVYGSGGAEVKHTEMKSASFGDAKFEHYNIRNKLGGHNSFHF